MSYDQYAAPDWWYENESCSDEYVLVEDHKKKIEHLKTVGADLLHDLIKAIRENDDIGIQYTIADLAQHLGLKI